MKRLLAGILCLALLFSLTACGGGANGRDAVSAGGSGQAGQEGERDGEAGDRKDEGGAEAGNGPAGGGLAGGGPTGGGLDSSSGPTGGESDISSDEPDAQGGDGVGDALPEASGKAFATDVAMTQYLIRQQTFQRNASAIGAGYDAAYCFLADHTFYWFASQHGEEAIPADNRQCRLKYGEWQVKEGRLLLTLDTSDWLEKGRWGLDNWSGAYFLDGGVFVRYDRLASLSEEYAIAEGQGCLVIGEEHYYPADLPLKDNDRMISWLKGWFSKEPAGDNWIPTLDDAAAGAEDADPFADPLAGLGSYSSDPEVIGAKGQPKPVPAGQEILRSDAAADVLPWSYYVSETQYEGQYFLMIWRDNPQGEAQWIASVAQPMLGFHQAGYVEGSLEGSDGRYLYFTIKNGSSQQSGLWCFDLTTECFSEVLPEPCGNMVVPQNPPPDLAGLGWIVYDHYIAAIDLDRGTTDEGMTMDNNQYGFFPEIGNSFFVPEEEAGAVRQPALTDLGGGALRVEFTTWDPASPAVEAKDRYQYDCLNFRCRYVGGSDRDQTAGAGVNGAAG